MRANEGERGRTRVFVVVVCDHVHYSINELRIHNLFTERCYMNSYVNVVVMLRIRTQADEQSYT